MQGGSLRESRKKRKSVPIHSFPKKTACSSYVQPWLAVVGSGWRLAVGRRSRLAAVGVRRFIAVGGLWRLVVGGWWSLGAVLKGGP